MSNESKAVFLSYASQDSEAAKKICEALRAAGIEVWFDQSELRGGDSWDQKIRKQIKECALFVPVISAATQARGEGYFRLEWKLAVDRSHLMARDQPFLVPVVLDATVGAAARVPDEFHTVQWTRIGSADSLHAFGERVGEMLGGPAEPNEPSAFNPELRTRNSELSQKDSGLGPPAVRRKWIWVSAAAVALIVAGFVAVLPKSGPAPVNSELRTPTARPRQPDNSEPRDFAPAKSLAVLPFANLSAQSENESFADGMHDDVITALSKIHDLKVISRTSVMTYKAGARNLKQIAAELGVGTVLEGSVQRAGNRIRLNVQLIDARTDAHLWAENYTEDVSDVFAVQSRLATAITTALKAALSPKEEALIALRPTENAEAYELYQQGRLLKQGVGLAALRDDYDRIVGLFDRAIQKDPGFALAYAELSRTHAIMYWFATLDATPARRAMSEKALRMAQRLGPDRPETLLAAGYFEYACRNDWAAAITLYLQAETGLPNDSEVPNWIGAAYRRLGRFPEALAAFERATALNPNDRAAITTLVQTTPLVRHTKVQLERAQRYLALFPSDMQLERLEAIAQYELDGDRNAYLRRLRHLAPERTDRFGLSRDYFAALQAGDLAAAERVLADPRFERFDPPITTRHVPGSPADALRDNIALYRAYVAFLSGRFDEARRLADEAIPALQALEPSPLQFAWVQISIARAEAYAGRLEAAVVRARAAVSAQEQRDRFVLAGARSELGRILVLAGEREEALGILRNELGKGAAPWPDNVRHDPIWSRLKDDQRFEEILRAAEAALRART